MTPQLWLIQSLKRQGILKSKSVELALSQVPREEFLWDKSGRALAYLDEPLRLGNTEQTISAPHMVVMMLEELELEPGIRVLEVGAGSGYNAALLAHILSRNQSASQKLVVSVEQNQELAQFARQNIERVQLDKWIQIVLGDGSLGNPEMKEEEIYDRIIVTAAAPSVPYFLKRQLKNGGILEMPIGNALLQTLVKVRKIGCGPEAIFKQENRVSCTFVPLLRSKIRFNVP